MSGYRLGVDIGGTFTDFALFDEAGRSLRIHKCLTTPEDPSRAVVEGAVAPLERESVDIAELREGVHGTTLVTNAVIERKGAGTGMLITEGFRDTPDMREEKRYDVFDLRVTLPEPIGPGHAGRVNSLSGLAEGGRAPRSVVGGEGGETARTVPGHVATA